MLFVLPVVVVTCWNYVCVCSPEGASDLVSQTAAAAADENSAYSVKCDFHTQFYYASIAIG